MAMKAPIMPASTAIHSLVLALALGCGTAVAAMVDMVQYSSSLTVHAPWL
jgi:hypothetical protein